MKPALLLSLASATAATPSIPKVLNALFGIDRHPSHHDHPSEFPGLPSAGMPFPFPTASGAQFPTASGVHFPIATGELPIPTGGASVGAPKMVRELKIDYGLRPKAEEKRQFGAPMATGELPSPTGGAIVGVPKVARELKIDYGLRPKAEEKRQPGVPVVTDLPPFSLLHPSATPSSVSLPVPVSSVACPSGTAAPAPGESVFPSVTKSPGFPFPTAPSVSRGPTTLATMTRVPKYTVGIPVVSDAPAASGVPFGSKAEGLLHFLGDLLDRDN